MADQDRAITPVRTGWCNQDIPLGHPSHARCTPELQRRETPNALLVCPCECHAAPVVAVVEPPTPDPVDEGAAFEPGFVHDMPDDVYHSDPVPAGSLSSTMARLLTDNVPAKARELRKRPATKAMTLGKAAHADALGTGPELIVWQHDGRTKAGKSEREDREDDIAAERAVAVTQAQHDAITGMAAALRAEPAVMAIFEASQREVSGFWQEGPIWCRARYDLLATDRAHDYKTCEDATTRGFSKALGNWGYHQQSDHYHRGLVALDHPAAARSIRFICQETSPPYLVQIHEPDVEAMEFARILNDRAITTFAKCLETGEWPGFPQLVNSPTALPPFYFADHDDALEMVV